MIGKTLTHYRITRKLASGGMGEVYVATDNTLDRDIALKLLPAEMAADLERGAARLDQPRIQAAGGSGRLLRRRLVRLRVVGKPRGHPPAAHRDIAGVSPDNREIYFNRYSPQADIWVLDFK